MLCEDLWVTCVLTSQDSCKRLSELLKHLLDFLSLSLLHLTELLFGHKPSLLDFQQTQFAARVTQQMYNRSGWIWIYWRDHSIQIPFGLRRDQMTIEWLVAMMLVRYHHFYRSELVPRQAWSSGSAFRPQLLALYTVKSETTPSKQAWSSGYDFCLTLSYNMSSIGSTEGSRFDSGGL